MEDVTNTGKGLEAMHQHFEQHQRTDNHLKVRVMTFIRCIRFPIKLDSGKTLTAILPGFLYYLLSDQIAGLIVMHGISNG